GSSSWQFLLGYFAFDSVIWSGSGMLFVRVKKSFAMLLTPFLRQCGVLCPMAPISTLTSDLWSTRGHRRNRGPDQGGKRQFTLMILSDMPVNGWKRLLPASLLTMRRVIVARMVNIAGIWTAECPSEMKMET